MEDSTVNGGTMVTDAEESYMEMIVVCPYIYCSKDMPYCTGMDGNFFHKTGKAISGT